MPTAISAYEVVDHGIQHSQYFQGCGVSFTEYDHCFTGSGDNPQEALEDALEQAAMSGFDVEHIDEELSDEPSVSAEAQDEAEQWAWEQDKARLDSEDDECTDPEDWPGWEHAGDADRYYYVSIRLKVGKAKKHKKRRASK